MSFGIAASSYVATGGPGGDSPYANALLSESPLVYWPLNETTGTVAADGSGNNHDGVYAGTYIQGQYSIVSGSTGRAVRSDGFDTSVTAAYAAWMDTGELTVLVSCMVPAVGIRMIAARYGSDGDPSLNSWFIDVGSGGNLYFFYRASTGSDVVINSGVVPVANKRLFIAAYVNAAESGIRVYEDDGVLLGSATGVGGVVQSSTANLTLFSSQQPNYGLSGYIDDFAMIGEALTTARIDQLAGLAFAPHQTWVAKSEGSAGRNGTNDHTISFTPAANGSLLVAVLGGAVTHTMVTPGWTKQISAIYNTELAVFTKVATAGESSFDVTHNGADYPVEYTVYEFPAGSSYHSGAGVQSDGPFPTLSGLPGANITVFALQSDYLGEGAPTVTTTWRYYWRTSVNRQTSGNGVTVGSWLNIGYFAFNDFPDATADIELPTSQYDALHYEQAALFAIQHA